MLCEMSEMEYENKTKPLRQQREANIHGNHETIKTKGDDTKDKRQKNLLVFVSRLSQNIPMAIQNVDYAHKQSVNMLQHLGPGRSTIQDKGNKQDS